MRCLLLTFDCLPRRWLGCYGSLDSTTRGFDRLAAAGTTFENAISTDVRSEVATIAGFQWTSDGKHALAAGRSLSFPTLQITSQDGPAPKPKGRRRTESRLSNELHQATAWMRDHGGPSLAWIRHPGLRLPPGPLSSPEDLASLLDQQAVIDEELDTFLDEWLDCADERWTFVLTSSRGVLRARTTVRRRSADPARPISDDLARVPLLILESRGESFGRRRLELLPTIALATAITGGRADSAASLTARLERFDPTRFVTIQGDEGTIAVRTPDWLFIRSSEPDREPGEGFLFRKPEDVCDDFDLRSVEANEAIRLDALIGE